MLKQSYHITLVFFLCVSLMFSILFPVIGEQFDKNTSMVGSMETCVSGEFVVNVEDDVVFSLTLTQNCEFILTDYQSNEQIYGGYSITDEIIQGRVSTILFFIDGIPIGEATLAWPLEDDLCIIINGVVFKKKKL